VVHQLQIAIQLVGLLSMTRRSPPLALLQGVQHIPNVGWIWPFVFIHLQCYAIIRDTMRMVWGNGNRFRSRPLGFGVLGDETEGRSLR